MLGCVITLRGIEDISAREVKEILNQKSDQHSSFITFLCKDKKDLYKLAYVTQSARYVGEVICLIKHNHEEYEKILEKVKKELKENITTKQQLQENLTENISFKITCVKEDYVSETSSPDIASELAKDIHVLTKSAPVYSTQDVDLILFITQEEALLFFDVSGCDLAKRDYKIFLTTHNLKAPLCYAALRLADYDSSKQVLDPFCGSGIIPIEAALFASKKSPNFFRKNKLSFYKTEEGKKVVEEHDGLGEKGKDKESGDKINEIWSIGDSFQHISSTKKNAKIAGTYDLLKYSRSQIEYLDAKFEEGTFDCIVTHPPILSKRSNEKKMMKLYEQFFDEVNFLLSKKGKCVLIGKNEKQFVSEAKRVGLRLVEQREVWQGKEKLFLFVLEK